MYLIKFYLISQLKLEHYFHNSDYNSNAVSMSGLSRSSSPNLGIILVSCTTLLWKSIIYKGMYRVFQNKRSRHYCIVCAMGEFLPSRGGSTVFCVPCGFSSDGRQNTWTRLTCYMYSLEECVFFVKSYYSTQKNLKEVLRLYGEQFNVPRHKWLGKSVIIT